MGPWDLNMGNPLLVNTGTPTIQPQTSPYIQAILALLAQAHPSMPVQGQALAPAEGPLGENAHLGWGTAKPMTAATKRTAAPTRKTKLGGYVGPANYSGAAHSRPSRNGVFIETFNRHTGKLGGGYYVNGHRATPPPGPSHFPHGLITPDQAPSWLMHMFDEVRRSYHPSFRPV